MFSRYLLKLSVGIASVSCQHSVILRRDWRGVWNAATTDFTKPLNRLREERILHGCDRVRIVMKIWLLLSRFFSLPCQAPFCSPETDLTREGWVKICFIDLTVKLRLTVLTIGYRQLKFTFFSSGFYLCTVVAADPGSFVRRNIFFRKGMRSVKKIFNDTLAFMGREKWLVRIDSFLDRWVISHYILAHGTRNKF